MMEMAVCPDLTEAPSDFQWLKLPSLVASGFCVYISRVLTAL